MLYHTAFNAAIVFSNQPFTGRSDWPFDGCWRLQSDILPQQYLQSKTLTSCVSPSQAWNSARFNYKCLGETESAQVMNCFLLLHQKKEMDKYCSAAEWHKGQTAIFFGEDNIFRDCIEGFTQRHWGCSGQEVKIIAAVRQWVRGRRRRKRRNMKKGRQKRNWRVHHQCCL